MAKETNGRSDQSGLTVDELVEALISISMVSKSLAKKVMMLSLEKDAKGGLRNERQRFN